MAKEATPKMMYRRLIRATEILATVVDAGEINSQGNLEKTNTSEKPKQTKL